MVTAPQSGVRAIDEGSLSEGSRLGAYVIERALGSGAYGAVYVARRMPLGNRFALKVLHPRFSQSPTTIARFMREAEATAALRHPHIVRTFEVGVVEAVPFLAMEFLEGETLEALLTREGAMPIEAAADILVPVCSAVAAVHAEGIVHRDLKPANIMLARPRPGVRHPVVLDFGVAKVLDPDALKLTGGSQVLGTPLYMAPEQLRDTASTGAKSDQWALGVILYECLCATTPFTASTFPELVVKVVFEEPVAPRARVPSIPIEVEAIVLRALQRSPDARFESVRALGAALLPYASVGVRASWEAEYASGVASTAATSVSATPTTMAPPARRWRAPVVGATLIALGALAAWRLSVARGPPAMTRRIDAPAHIVAVRPSAPVIVAADVVTAVAPDAEAPTVIAQPVAPRRVLHNHVTPVRPVAPAETVVVGANGAVMR